MVVREILMSQLSSYRYFASRMLLVALLPALLFWLDSGLSVALKVFSGFTAVTQLAGLWIYRRDVLAALRRRRR